MPEPTVEQQVLQELQTLRKSAGGVQIENLARAPVICQLLGAGDPFLAYSRLQHLFLDATADRTMRAAGASIGFASDADTHLDRLDAAGIDLHLDQRQVRRLSDQGLTTIARLIATNLALESVPELTALIARTPAGFELHISSSRPHVVEMSAPTVEILIGEGKAYPPLDWITGESSDRGHLVLRNPIHFEAAGVETSAVIVWRGELWPKFAVVWQGEHRNVTSETLGNKLMLRITTWINA